MPGKERLDTFLERKRNTSFQMCKKKKRGLQVAELCKVTEMSKEHFQQKDDEEPKEIWIIGNFIILRAAEVAKNRPYGKNLGLEEKHFIVRWISKSSWEWRHVWSEVSQASLAWGDPCAVFIHLGDNEFAKRIGWKFARAVDGDFQHLTKTYPATAFIWSPILPRDWPSIHVEENRKQFNIDVSSSAEKYGVQVAGLSEAEEMIQQAFEKNQKIHWKEDSCEIMDSFNKSMIESINKAICNVTERDSV